MRKAIRIGNIFGIEIALDRSWFLVFALVLWSLSSVFGAWHPLWTGGTRLAVATVTGAAFFASLLLHELAHALVAKLFGIPVRDITLHMFGGVSNLEREPATPGAELAIAIVGPIVSLALGVVMILAVGAPFSSSGEGLASLGPTRTLLTWLGPVNIGLGLFNLIPGFPLDGGRIFRAVTWKITGNLRTATRLSSGVGQVFGFGFLVMGAAMAFGARLPFFGTGLGPGLWIAMIGLFLRSAARSQEAGSEVAAALSDVAVGSVMRPVNGVEANTSVQALVDDTFVAREATAASVVFGERVVGLVSIDEVARVPRAEWGTRTVREIMIDAASVAAVSPSDPALDALRRMAKTGLRALPVAVSGTVVGVVFQSDLAGVRRAPTASPRAGETPV